MKENVYITMTGCFLPGEPISNAEMESYLGFINNQPSRYKNLILKKNGIKFRYYALNREGKPTHLNEELAANAAKHVLRRRQMGIENIGMLATATSCPDLLMPGFASMVHGRLGGKPMDILSVGGICCAGIAALKAAWLAVQSGENSNALVVASENSSIGLRGERFSAESQWDISQENTESNTYRLFDADFLRWMLSDGAGAVLLERFPNPSYLSFKIEWIEMRSYANSLPLCMYAGTTNPEALSVDNVWLAQKKSTLAKKNNFLIIQQNTELLHKMITIAVEELQRIQADRNLDIESIDYFLPHLSSYFFYDKLVSAFQEANIQLPTEKWFINLETKGNMGAASIFVALDDACQQHLFKQGDRILLAVPESGRFAMAYVLLTCVNT